MDPLKRAWVKCLQLAFLVSHGQKAVDPLKQVLLWEYVPRLVCLPRSEGRGPIEALLAGVTSMHLLQVSHGQKAVDPLKP